MRVLLILSLFLLMSCQKSQNLGSSQSSIFPLEERSYLVINHNAGESILRRKLLNFAVNEIIGDTTVKESHALKAGDVYRQVNNEFLVSNEDKEGTSEKSKQFLKLVVSYETRIEIYFVPEDRFVNMLIEDLKLTPDVGHKFLMLGNKISKTIKGQTLYLVSYNKEELLENDKFFNEKTVATKSITIQPHQEIIIEGNFRLYIQRKEPRASEAYTTCPVRNRGPGYCTTCTYTIDLPTQKFDRNPLVSVSDFNLVFNIDDGSYGVDQINFLEKRNEYFKAFVVGNEKNQDLNITIRGNRSIASTAMPYAHSSTNCMAYSEEISIEAQYVIDVVMTVKGRGNDLAALIR